MNRLRTVQAASDARRALRDAIAAVLLLGTAATAAGQNVPYQSAARGQFSNSGLPAAFDPGGEFQPRLELAAQYVGNINLAPDGEPQIDTAGLEAAPGLLLSYATNAVKAALDYSLIGRAWEDSDYNDISHRLAANGQWLAVPEWFAVRGSASYKDVVIDPSISSNYSGRGLFGTGNLAEQAAASIAPLLSRQFGPVDFEAQYRYGRTWILDEGKGVSNRPDTDLRDSEDQDARVNIGTADRGQSYFLSARYNWQRTATGGVLRYLYEEAAITGGYQVSRDFMLTTSVGLESDPAASRTAGGLEEDWWDVGVIYNPDDRLRAEFRYGQRFFGDSYFASVQRVARLLTLRASYTEMPTVQSRTASLNEFDPGDLPPAEGPDEDFVRFSGSPFLLRSGNVSAVLNGNRTRLDLSLNWSERNYLNELVPDLKSQGAGLGASRQLSEVMSLDFSARYSDRTDEPTLLTPDGSSFQDTTITLQLNRKITPKLTTSAEFGYVDRTGDRVYDAWWTGLRARYTP